VDTLRRHPLTLFGASLALAAAIAALLPASDGRDGWSLFPPLVAVSVAVLTGRLVLGLSLAVFSGAVLSLIGQVPLYSLPLAAAQRALVDFLWTPLYDSFQLYILGFTVGLIGMVRVVALAGGTRGIAEFLAARAGGARSAAGATYLMGLAIFFDDYANTLVVGTTMRPLADRFRLSREKLAYLVDSTAAPVAGIAVVSTWIGYEVGLFDEFMRQLDTGVSGYELFFMALPLRFYCLLSLLFVGLVTFLRRDFGPMLKAERRALHTGALIAAADTPMSGKNAQAIEPPSGIACHWWVAAVPVGLVIAGVFAFLHLDAWAHEAVLLVRRQHGAWSQDHLTAVFSNAHSARAMFWAAIAGNLAAFALALTRRDTDGGRPISATLALRTWVGGVAGFQHALAILILAWAIKETCQAVDTSGYLVSILAADLDPSLLPLAVFLLAALTAFAIGTSWSTMAILLPTVLPLAHTMGGLPLTAMVAAAVLDGAIFGDHCSPISDTTILSSIASSCDHLAHVRTQIPYALTAMAAAGICGYLGAPHYGAGVGLLLGGIFLLGMLFVFGRNPERL
jgi:Na+/H+ antiporter NhaC